jgi:hypothetical protein
MAQNTEMVLFYAPNPADPAILKAQGNLFFRMKYACARSLPTAPPDGGTSAGLKDCPPGGPRPTALWWTSRCWCSAAFPPPGWNSLLKHLRQAQVRFPYKAVLTPPTGTGRSVRPEPGAGGGAPPDERPGPGGLIPGISCGIACIRGKGGIMAWLGAGRQTRREGGQGPFGLRQAAHPDRRSWATA